MSLCHSNSARVGGGVDIEKFRRIACKAMTFGKAAQDGVGVNVCKSGSLTASFPNPVLARSQKKKITRPE
jgi:hypothetical protein